jgi:hypothetical protein
MTVITTASRNSMQFLLMKASPYTTVLARWEQLRRRQADWQEASSLKTMIERVRI